MDITKGYRTTEFWLSLAAFACGVFVASGVLPSTHWGMKLAGALLAGLGTLGYGISRGLSKLGGASNGVVKALLPLALCGALLAGCVCSTPRACLSTAHTALVLADKPALDTIGKRCMSEAEKCGPVGSANCPGWQKCDAARKAYRAALDAIDGSLAVCNRTLYDLEVK